MSKISNFPKLLTLVIRCAVYINSAQAQQAATEAASRTGAKPRTAVSFTANQPVYFNYKGITNLEEAKVAWIKDNPELYEKMKQQNLAPATQKTANEAKPEVTPKSK